MSREAVDFAGCLRMRRGASGGSASSDLVGWFDPALPGATSGWFASGHDCAGRRSVGNRPLDGSLANHLKGHS